MSKFFNGLRFTGKCYLVLDIVIIVSFLFLPFISLGGLISGSACYFPYQILLIYLNIQSLVNGDTLFDNAPGNNSSLFDLSYSLELYDKEVLEGFAVLSLLYLILLFAIIALVCFFLKKEKLFINFSFVTSVITLVSTVAIWGIQYYFLSYLPSTNSDVADILDSELASDLIDQIITLGIGYYILLIAAAIGFIIFFLPKKSVQQRPVTAQPKQPNGTTTQMPTAPVPNVFNIPLIPENTDYSYTKETKVPKKSEQFKVRLLNEAFPGSAIRIEVLPLIFGSGEKGSIKLSWVNPGTRFGLYEYNNEIVLTDEGENPGIKLNGVALTVNKCYRLENGDVINVDGRDIQIEI